MPSGKERLRRKQPELYAAIRQEGAEAALRELEAAAAALKHETALLIEQTREASHKAVNLERVRCLAIAQLAEQHNRGADAMRAIQDGLGPGEFLARLGIEPKVDPAGLN